MNNVKISNHPPLENQKKVVDLFNQKRYQEAETAAQKITNIYSKSGFGWKILGAIFFCTQRYEEALSALLQANQLSPNDAECLNTLGLALQALDRINDALICFNRAIEIDSDYALAFNNLGTVLSNLGRLEEALSCYDRALNLIPDSANFYSNKALTLYYLGRTEASLMAFNHALIYEPKNVEILNRRGILLERLGFYQEALASYNAALAIKPDMADALSNKGNILKDQGLLQKADDYYNQALRIQPSLREAWHNRLLNINYRSDLLRNEIFEAHRDFDCQLASKIMQLPAIKDWDRDPQRRLRVGLVSGDFRYHSVAFFLHGIFRYLDRKFFELFCYMTSHDRDDVTKIFKSQSDEWRDVARFSSRALANQIRTDHVDILIDLSGHTAGNMLLTFAAKAAPIQVTWLGYPNTTGLSAIDYRLVDAITDLAGDADMYHTECLVRLPYGFLCYTPPEKAYLLPTGNPPCLNQSNIHFGSFNTLAKLTPATLDLWSQVLNAVPTAYLVLKTPKATDTRIWEHVIAEFAQRGIAQERLKLFGRVASPIDHLSLYQQIDIALDSYPYTGTTTTCEALFMGVPTITLAGDRHAARVGASILTHANLSELIAYSPDEYVQLAVSLANDQSRLLHWRTRLREQFECSPLRDEIGFTRTFEAALRQMWQLWCAGETPRAFNANIHASLPLAKAGLKY